MSKTCKAGKLLIVAAHPTSVPQRPRSAKSPLGAFIEFAEEHLSRGLVIHLLPFYPSDGEGGFAPSDWVSVDPSIGSTKHLEILAENHPLMLGGIYNHAGKSHLFARQFRQFPYIFAENFYAMPSVNPADYPPSPRGGYVMRPIKLEGKTCHLWQPYSDLAYDLNLESTLVCNEIKRQLNG
ncbi:hypothetical protein ACWEOG_15120 [Amycolatopsis japonica]